MNNDEHDRALRYVWSVCTALESLRHMELYVNGVPVKNADGTTEIWMNSDSYRKLRRYEKYLIMKYNARKKAKT